MDLRCPECGKQANNVDGNPFSEMAGNPFAVVTEMHVFCECDNGHKWFEAAKFNRDGTVAGRHRGPAEAGSAWSREPADPPKEEWGPLDTYDHLTGEDE